MRCRGAVQTSPRLIARRTRNSTAHGGQKHHVEFESAIADDSEAQDVDADDPLDPDQQADDPYGDGQLHQRPGDGRPKIPPQSNLVLVVLGQLGQDGVEVSRLFARPTIS